MNFNEIIRSFQDEMLRNAITPPQEIIPDGDIHRFYIDGDKRGSKNGWYVLYLDGVPCGVFGSWKKGSYWKWSLKRKECMSITERNDQIKKIHEASKRRNDMKAREELEASLKAENLWNSYKSADPNHLYFMKKRILPFTARQCGNKIAIKIVDIKGKIWSLQYISELGKKRFLTDGSIKQHFMPIQGFPGDGRKILICEGFATGATLATKYTNYCVIAACDSGNLKSVAMAIREHLPSIEIVICADDDRLNPDNPGINKGREAAIAAGALFSKPKWPEGAPEDLEDFNDLECWLADNGAYHV